MLTFTKVWGSGVLGCCCHLQVPLRSQQGPRADPLPLLQIPIQESLIEFVDGGLNKLAAEAFQGRQGHEWPVPLSLSPRRRVGLDWDGQRSPGCSHRDSCQRGWRLLYILAAYYKCSEVLRPFLLAFLQDASRHPELPFHGIAKACEQNLRKTQQFGGRSLFPSSMELKAMVAGRSAKRQLFLLPGGIERHLKIKTCSVSRRGQDAQCTPRLW
uniref:MyTH4 domain-containing protein n=1 Tax=Taeniopygia guttata TaxID=59729 RepID=A0A674HED1_TAEGU